MLQALRGLFNGRLPAFTPSPRTRCSSQTVAGATATNTHGTGLVTGGLSSFIQGARVCVANGYCASHDAQAPNPVMPPIAVSCFSPGIAVGPSMVDPGLFAALRTGYGALGIVTSLDLAVVPLWRMEEVGEEEWQERGGETQVPCSPSGCRSSHLCSPFAPSSITSHR